MATMTMTEIARELCYAAGCSIIVVDVWSNEDQHLWPRRFASLDADQIEMIGKPFAIRFDDRDKAREAYETLCRETILEEPYAVAGGRIQYFEQIVYSNMRNDVAVVDFCLTGYLRPVHVESFIWTTERIPGRDD